MINFVLAHRPSVGQRATIICLIAIVVVLRSTTLDLLLIVAAAAAELNSITVIRFAHYVSGRAPIPTWRRHQQACSQESHWRQTDTINHKFAD